MTNIEWREPPAAAAPTRTDWKAVVAELREHPGRWAKVYTAPNTRAAASTASSLRSGRYGEAQPDEVEARTDGTDVYARVGGGA